MRIADPRPGFCSSCYGAVPERRFVDFESAFDGAPVFDKDSGTIAILPWTHDLSVHDDLYLCEKCVQEAAELLDVKPQQRADMFNRARAAELDRDHWRDYARRLEATLQQRPEAAPSARPARRAG